MKNKGNENKIILGDFNWRNKMERDGGNKIISRCCFNYALSKLVVDNGLKDLWRRDNPDFSEFTCYSRSSGTSSRIHRVYTDVKIASNTKITRIMVSFIDHYNAIFIDRLPSQIKIGREKIRGTLIILFYASLSSPQLKRLLLLKTQKSHSSASD